MARLPRPPDDPAARHREPAVGARPFPATTTGSWRGLRVSIHDDGTGSITPLPGAHVTASLLHQQLDAVAGRVHRLTTSALGVHDAAPWLAAGFTPATELVLLRADTRVAAPRPRNAIRLRAGRRKDWAALAELDAAAFAPQAGLGLGGLLDAMAVTPSARLRVAGNPAEGFVIAGHDVRCGYLQRLAVAPRSAGHGIGASLVVDTLRWLHRRGAREVLVNTEAGNARALALYERHGFARGDEGLVVLEWQR